MAFETRTVAATFEMRDDSTTGAPTLEGYAATFGRPYDMGPFCEQVDRRAFDLTLGLSPDVRLLVDHTGQPLARTKSGTLALSVDDSGLHARATLDPADPDVQRLLPKMRRGDLDEMSFAFRVAPGGDAWDYTDPERTMRTLNEVSLAGGDVSVVTYPANPTTSVSVRARDLHEARCVFVEQMAREFRGGGHALSSDNIAKLQQVLSQLADADTRGLDPADTALGAATAELADVLKVAPDPDPGDGDTPARGMHPDMARRILAAADAAPKKG